MTIWVTSPFTTIGYAFAPTPSPLIEIVGGVKYSPGAERIVIDSIPEEVPGVSSKKHFLNIQIFPLVNSNHI